MANADVTEVAKYQRLLILAISAHIVMVFVGIAARVNAVSVERVAGEIDPTMLVVGLIQLTVGIASIVMLMLLMSALQRPMVSRILAAIAMLIPLIGLIVLLAMNQRATKTLQAAGYTVGLMGAKPK
jgi:hypothetical protein